MSWQTGGGTYLRQGESAARPLVVFIGALELKVLPSNPPQHSSQLLLQLQLPAEQEGKNSKNPPGGGGQQGARNPKDSTGNENFCFEFLLRHLRSIDVPASWNMIGRYVYE